MAGCGLFTRSDSLCVADRADGTMWALMCTCLLWSSCPGFPVETVHCRSPWKSRSPDWLVCHEVAGQTLQGICSSLRQWPPEQIPKPHSVCGTETWWRPSIRRYVGTFGKHAVRGDCFCWLSNCMVTPCTVSNEVSRHPITSITVAALGSMVLTRAIRFLGEDE